MPRLGFALRLNDKSSIRVGWARYIQPSSRIRDSLGDFVDAYTGYSTVTNTLNPTFTTTPGEQQHSIAIKSLPNIRVGFNPVRLVTQQTLGIYRAGNSVAFDEFEQKPPLNDKFTAVYQREIWNKMVFFCGLFL